MRLACWLLPLLLALPLPGRGNDMPSILLVAKREMADPFFRRAVVLVTHRAGPVPMGVILNKVTKVPLAQALPGLERRPAPERRLYFGGPVAADGLIVAYRTPKAPEGAIEALSGVVLSSDLEVVRTAVNGERAQDVRVFMGYASWGPGQLEAEIARGDWLLLPADAATIFDLDPETLWRDLEQQAVPKNARYPLRGSGAHS